MKRLTLLRHAKSSWRDPDLDDFDRPLNSRGQLDAPMMGKRLAGRGFQPDLLLASPSRRTVLTIEAVAGQLGIDPAGVIFDKRIYEATVEELVDLVRAIPDDRQNVLLVGHNPGLTDLANFLVEVHLKKMPTCSVFCVELQVHSWRQLGRNCAGMLFYDYPKKNEA